MCSSKNSAPFVVLHIFQAACLRFCIILNDYQDQESLSKKRDHHFLTLGSWDSNAQCCLNHVGISTGV